MSGHANKSCGVTTAREGSTGRLHGQSGFKRIPALDHLNGWLADLMNA